VALDTLPKYVVSTTFTDPRWANTTVLSSEVAAAVVELRAKPGRELQVHSSRTLIRWLLDNYLVDEITLLTFPVVDGPHPGDIRDRLPHRRTMWSLVKTTSDSCNLIAVARHIRFRRIRCFCVSPICSPRLERLPHICTLTCQRPRGACTPASSRAGAAFLQLLLSPADAALSGHLLLCMVPCVLELLPCWPPSPSG
jgi:RibD C-terminal domain